MKIVTSLYQKLTLGSGIVCIEEYEIRESLCNLLLLPNITKININYNSYIIHFSSQLCLEQLVGGLFIQDFTKSMSGQN